jgi:hypothetical protein
MDDVDVPWLESERLSASPLSAPGCCFAYGLDGGWPAVTLRLRVGIEVAGRVVVPEGVDPTEVAVSAVWSEPWRHGGLCRVWADAEGAFRISVPASVPTVDLRAVPGVPRPAASEQHSDHGPLDATLALRGFCLAPWSAVEAGASASPLNAVTCAWREDVHGGREPVELVLRRSRPLRLVGRGPDGDAATIYGVQAWCAGKEFEGLPTPGGSGADVAALGLPDGTYHLVARLPHGLARAVVTVPSDVSVVLEAPPVVDVTGHVEACADPESLWFDWIPDASAPPGTFRPSGTVEPDGRFALQIEPSASGTLWFGSHRLDVFARVSGVVGSATPLRVLLERGLAITGRVVGLDPAWKERPGVRAEQGGFLRVTDVDARGEFHLTGLAPGPWSLGLTLRPYSEPWPCGSFEAGSSHVVLTIPDDLSTSTIAGDDPAPSATPR